MQIKQNKSVENNINSSKKNLNVYKCRGRLKMMKEGERAKIVQIEAKIKK